ncbi:hypothetical protein Cylst_3392 [Cylindrospermum stagnale PCC 7417]|uniref:DUF4258 domain-containing protein n=1 Tax=Cylindrospermum stagnale PCC 7417 TaxID=56107 RepID=K9X1C3_9NOST|nr:hypothetical protein [Cylindrospermum stagnale]AFZ25542.1 hypothetical protein Cylst_3392 [Cylindrospermum stagnale PCC 7417]
MQSKVFQLWPANSTRHLKDQAQNRGIREAEVDAAYQHGEVYVDPDYGGTVRWDSSTEVAVCIKPDGTVTTCYQRTGPKSRWKKKTKLEDQDVSVSPERRGIL